MCVCRSSDNRALEGAVGEGGGGSKISGATEKYNTLHYTWSKSNQRQNVQWNC